MEFGVLFLSLPLSITISTTKAMLRKKSPAEYSWFTNELFFDCDSSTYHTGRKRSRFDGGEAASHRVSPLLSEFPLQRYEQWNPQRLAV